MPSPIAYSGPQKDANEIELRFKDWRLGDVVPKHLLDEAKFTEDEIIAEVDFAKWEQLFITKRRK